MKYLLTVILIIMPSFINAEYNKGISQELYSNICGVWDLSLKRDFSDMKVSWGRASVAPDTSIVIDLGADCPYLLENVMGRHDIIKISKIGKNYIITMFYHPSREDNTILDLEISVIDENTIRFNETESLKKYPIMDYVGKKYRYFKVCGPEKIFYKPKISTLLMRSMPSVDSKVIRALARNKKLLILRRDKDETIQGLKGNWVKVLTEKAEIGWCFDAYLQPL